jgi:hypothetical protein|tara:strand:- start:476 stop:739 length:264 start_codon:yes stop_codon:yes gene_type:complete
MEIEKGIPMPARKLGEYKEECINLLLKMDVGDSILVKNRTRDTVRYWTIHAERRHRNRNSFNGNKSTKRKYKIATIEHKQQRIWRVI